MRSPTRRKVSAHPFVVLVEADDLPVVVRVVAVAGAHADRSRDADLGGRTRVSAGERRENMCFLCQLDKMKCHDKIKKLNGRRRGEGRREGWRRRHFKSDEMERDLSTAFRGTVG